VFFAVIVDLGAAIHAVNSPRMWVNLTLGESTTYSVVKSPRAARQAGAWGICPV
jgi:hypothetical protein